MYKFAFRNIVHRLVQPRSPFDKTNYIKDYIPVVRDRKPRQAKWDDPDYHWPPTMPRYTNLKNRALVTEVENEYLSSLKETKKFPIVNTGDIVEVTSYLSMSTLQTSVFTGICIGRRRKNTLNSSLNILGAIDGVHIEMHIKLWSPMIKEIKVVEAGSGNFRNRLNYIREFPITTYKALKRGTKKKDSMSYQAKKEEHEMRQKVIKGIPIEEDPE